MNKALESIIKYGPTTITLILLLCIQLLFINANILGIYIYGVLYTEENNPKVFLISCIVSLLYDAVKLQTLGIWALSFFIVAALLDGILSMLKIKKELQSHTLRGDIFLFLIVTGSAAIQSTVQHIIIGQKLALDKDWSIVIYGLLFIVVRKIYSSHKPYNYLKI